VSSAGARRRGRRCVCCAQRSSERSRVYCGFKLPSPAPTSFPLHACIRRSSTVAPEDTKLHYPRRSPSQPATMSSLRSNAASLQAPQVRGTTQALFRNAMDDCADVLMRRPKCSPRYTCFACALGSAATR
jgi:hypothetical protein